jgi:hypothetical protein
MIKITGFYLNNVEFTVAYELDGMNISLSGNLGKYAYPHRVDTDNKEDFTPVYNLITNDDDYYNYFTLSYYYSVNLVRIFHKFGINQDCANIINCVNAIFDDTQVKERFLDSGKALQHLQQSLIINLPQKEMQH